MSVTDGQARIAQATAEPVGSGQRPGAGDTCLRRLAIIGLAAALAACGTAGSGPAAPSAPASSAATAEASQANTVAEGESAAAATPPGEQPAVPGQAQQAAPRKIGAGVDRLYFLPEKMEIDDASMKRLLEHAARLKANPRQVVALTAYTENLGSRSYNVAVAEEELSAVAGLLRSLGVPKKQIRRHTPGLARTAASCSTQACRQKARHVDLAYQ